MSRSRPGCAQRLALLGAVAALVTLSVVPPPSRAPVPLPAQLIGSVSGGTASAFPPVQTEQPVLRLRNAQGPDTLQRVVEVPGVSFATVIEVAEVPVAGVPVRVAAVDPEGFRVLTPQVTADAVIVWERLVKGDAAFTHDAGHRLEVPLGSVVPAAGPAAGPAVGPAASPKTLRIGAYASNGVPPVADAIVSQETGERLGLQGEQQLYSSVDQGASPEEVAQRIAETVGAKPDVIPRPSTQRASLAGANARYTFEPYTYVDNGDGTIQMSGDWVRRNIVRARVPILGDVSCHRLMTGQLRGALQEIADRGLADLVDIRDYGGCWSPRHIDFNPRKPLSMHSWGLAVDLNVSTNPLGATPTLDSRIVEIFERWGFVWGGRWRRPDGMHFELGALLHSPQG